MAGLRDLLDTLEEAYHAIGAVLKGEEDAEEEEEEPDEEED